MWLMGTVTAVVMLFGYHTSTSGPQPSQFAASGPVPGGSAGSTGSTGSGTTSPKATHAPAGNGPQATRVVTGPVAQTQWGPVQVQLTVSGNKITKVHVPVYPNGSGIDQQINAYALPRLVQETLSAQSAQIQMISGATVTSGGYLQSLQGALNQAGI
jgi:uncharacterized protein with FMN-binding domain